MHRRMAASAVVVVAALGGCGGGGGEDPSPGDVVKTYLKALASGDSKKACDQLTGDAKREALTSASENLPELQASSCADALEKVADSLGGDETAPSKNAEVEKATIYVEKVTIDGDTATVSIRGGFKEAELKRSGGRWYISGGVFETASAN